MADVRFDDQVAVVTGAGRGLGRAYAMELAQRGARVIVNDVGGAERDDRADRVVEEIRAAGGEAVADRHDLTTPADARAVIAGAVDQWGSVDILINNAGFLRNNYFEDLTEDEIEQVLSVHLRAAIYLSQAAWKIMKDKAYGRILLTSSSSALFSHQGLANYAAAKAGLVGLCRALAYEGRDRDINVNCILPTAATQIGIEHPIPGFLEELSKVISPEAFELLGSRATPESVAPLAVALVSRRCQVSGEAFQAILGHFARVFIGVSTGWSREGTENATVESVLENLDAIRSVAGGFTELSSVYDEMATVTTPMLTS